MNETNQCLMKDRRFLGGVTKRLTGLAKITRGRAECRVYVSNKRNSAATKHKTETALRAVSCLLHNTR